MGHKRFEPPLIIDLGPVWQEKLDLVRCFPSPLRPETPADTGEHLLFGADILERVEAKARLCGERIGARYGDPCSAVVSTVVSCQPATCWRSPAAAPSARRGRSSRNRFVSAAGRPLTRPGLLLPGHGVRCTGGAPQRRRSSGW